LIYNNLYSGWLPWDSYWLSFFPPHSFPVHSIYQFHLIYQSCLTALFLP
jgi:hypothetical protein